MGGQYPAILREPPIKTGRPTYGIGSIPYRGDNRSKPPGGGTRRDRPRSLLTNRLHHQVYETHVREHRKRNLNIDSRILSPPTKPNNATHNGLEKYSVEPLPNKNGPAPRAIDPRIQRRHRLHQATSAPCSTHGQAEQHQNTHQVARDPRLGCSSSLFKSAKLALEHSLHRNIRLYAIQYGGRGTELVGLNNPFDGSRSTLDPSKRYRRLLSNNPFFESNHFKMPL